MSLVLDASAALAWIFERADPDEAQAAARILNGLEAEETIVPELWHLEVLNGLVTAARRGVASVSETSDYLARLETLPIRTDDLGFAARKSQVFALAREHGLSAYDAAYLDLALRTGSSLATFDRKLAAAREAAGVPAP